MKIEEINSPKDIRNLKINELKTLANDIRSFLLENVSSTGGHLSSNLGVVELTIALHYVFDTPNDKILFDVGHQCYTHKILTGRAKDFSSLRKYQGLSGFIDKEESLYDVFESGHSSTSISAQCGFLKANAEQRVVSLIGDASLQNGVAFEALNYMGGSSLNPIICFNDNKMSISRGIASASSRIFSKLRSTKFYQSMNNGLVKITPKFLKKLLHRFKTSIKGLILKENLFETYGYDYLGPYDGNDLEACIAALKMAKNINKPCVIHFITKKGKGYKLAENDLEGLYHGVGPFDVQKGVEKKKKENVYSYSELFAKALEKQIEKEEHYVITPAMVKGSALDEAIKKYPKNIIDVGIAEEHAAVMASAMAQANKKVTLLLYSTFSQRSFDYILNDIARRNVKVVLGIDRADFVPGDGSTHQGVYDIAMFNMMPNMMITMPSSPQELFALVDYADNINSPIVIRYPKACCYVENFEAYPKIEKPSWTKLKEGKDIIIIAYGENVNYVKEVVDENNLDATIVNARFISPLDEEMLRELFKENKPILVYENVVVKGGFIDNIYEFIRKEDIQSYRLYSMGLDKDIFIPVGEIEELRKHFSLAKEDILQKINSIIK